MIKKIFTNTYTVLFIYVPIIAHIAGFIFMLLAGTLSDILRLFPLNDDLYQVLENIFHLFFALLLLLLPLGFGSYFWAKKFINELNFKTYFAIFALLIY
ncbi:MAG: hypothetical protein LBF13_02710, partial [Campylobacteraceae bacterium]|nr:hypothetical protein [Campylobacteraceae bacterium]